MTSPSLHGSPDSRRRFPPHQHDIGFSDTVSNLVEIVKNDQKKYYGKRPRGSWSASTSPAGSPSLSIKNNWRYCSPQRNYATATTILGQRSRSPSPRRSVPQRLPAIGIMCELLVTEL